MQTPENIPLLSNDAHEKLRSRFGGAINTSRSPLTIKIIAFNLVALSLLVTGILYLNQSRDGLIDLRKQTLTADATVLSLMLEQQMETDGIAIISDRKVSENLATLAKRINSRAQLYTVNGDIVASIEGNPETTEPIGLPSGRRTNSLNDLWKQAWSRISAIFNRHSSLSDADGTRINSTSLVLETVSNQEPLWAITQNGAQQTIITVAAPVFYGGKVQGVLALSTLGGEIDSYLSGERVQILQVFFLAIATSVFLSIILANTIGRPLKDLAAAAKQGSSRKSGRFSSERVNIPDMTGRPDEIGELSRQLRNMTTALYDRIEANESFAADVAHEIKNPLTSLRSAVESMNYAKDDGTRQKLLDVIKDDVDRMDRLVTDISNASRLDAELAKDEMEEFNLCELLQNIVNYQAELASAQDVTVEADLFGRSIDMAGLPDRLAQVFVNLITNAVSFVPPGGKVTVKVNKEGEDIFVTVEDTGPGIPEDNLKDVFKRFYSSRPKQEFGNNSGLGLAISRQIVEAHGGSIWAENIYGDGQNSPKGARFTVKLPA